MFTAWVGYSKTLQVITPARSGWVDAHSWEVAVPPWQSFYPNPTSQISSRYSLLLMTWMLFVFPDFQVSSVVIFVLSWGFEAVVGHPFPLWMCYLGRMALCIFLLVSWTLSWSMDCWEIAWASTHLLLLECWLTVHSWKKKQEPEFNSIQWQFIVGAFPLYLCQWNFEKWLKFHVARKRGLLSVTNAWIHFLKLILFAAVPLLLFCYIGWFCCLPVLNSLLSPWTATLPSFPVPSSLGSSATASTLSNWDPELGYAPLCVS